MSRAWAQRRVLIAGQAAEDRNKVGGAEFTEEDADNIRDLAAFAGTTLDALRAARGDRPLHPEFQPTRATLPATGTRVCAPP
jgi:hypothetical protein